MDRVSQMGLIWSKQIPVPTINHHCCTWGQVTLWPPGEAPEAQDMEIGKNKVLEQAGSGTRWQEGTLVENKGEKAKETTEIAYLFNAKTDLEENLCHPSIFLHNPSATQRSHAGSNQWLQTSGGAFAKQQKIGKIEKDPESNQLIEWQARSMMDRDKMRRRSLKTIQTPNGTITEAMIHSGQLEVGGNQAFFKEPSFLGFPKLLRSSLKAGFLKADLFLDPGTAFDATQRAVRSRDEGAGGKGSG
ncbi:hypothetical protein K438DRAFT_1775832 [Mycena galopus ATCC 62051]|nr:hypothetical protein K438DRAFT_1775832 [Mycena galopus ATCC 62051]